MNVLITGGAGFIGTHLGRRLLREGCSVTVLDNFSPQIHGGRQEIASDLAEDVRLLVGDIRDDVILTKALENQDVVVHLAAETGTGQSMYELKRYESVNVGGTAAIIEYIVRSNRSRIQKLVVASSRAVYGEGQYTCDQHGPVFPLTRSVVDMKAGRFEPRCPVCGEVSAVAPTREDCPLQPSSFYGLTKQVQEQMTLLFARTLGISAFALRYQNVYGPGQSLKNPYTGILAIFSNQARLNEPIQVFEDGLESRDMVYIDDVIEATWLSISAPITHVEALNVGSGIRTEVRTIVEEIIHFFESRSQVSVTGAFREGDIRHNVADLSKVRRTIGFEPACSFKDGIGHFLSWAASQPSASSAYETSLNEMRQRGLFYG